MVKKESKMFFVASACFFLAGIFEILNSQFVFGFSFITFGFVFLTLGVSNKKKVIDLTLVKKDEAFLNLISEGNKIKAIKRCRSITNCGLKEASDYVESMDKECNPIGLCKCYEGRGSEAD
ncbi:ribosomal protein L7/L12 [Fusibacter sp. 3D3]|uniref:ribosomal protein L7/L12 n=1 Tax=Fusibacter sp. 3D3 TaxID=1048380 RepID=UPI000853BAD1|nr:ribosomal protein L7/L12 [Fusibacter sp. 3D3]